MKIMSDLIKKLSIVIIVIVTINSSSSVGVGVDIVLPLMLGFSAMFKSDLMNHLDGCIQNQ